MKRNEFARNPLFDAELIELVVHLCPELAIFAFIFVRLEIRFMHWYPSGDNISAKRPGSPLESAAGKKCGIIHIKYHSTRLGRQAIR